MLGKEQAAVTMHQDPTLSFGPGITQEIITRVPDPKLADAILDRTIHNAYRLSLLDDSLRKLRGNRTMPHT